MMMGDPYASAAGGSVYQADYGQAYPQVYGGSAVVVDPLQAYAGGVSIDPLQAYAGGMSIDPLQAYAGGMGAEYAPVDAFGGGVVDAFGAGIGMGGGMAAPIEYSTMHVQPGYDQGVPMAMGSGSVTGRGYSEPVSPQAQYDSAPTVAEPLRDETQSVVSDAWTLALSEITYRPGQAVPLNLMEELLLLKAGDKPKFSRSDKIMDRIVAAALLLELVHERKISVDGEYTTDPRKLVLRLVDDSHTGSNIINSAITAIKKHSKGPLFVSVILDRIANAGGGITQKMLWRLVQKQKVAFDPHAFGKDKYPVVGGANDLAVLRERVVQAMDQGVEAPVLRNQMLAFLYYLPRNAADKVFPQHGSIEEVFLICRAIAASLHQYQQQRSSFL